MSDYLSRAADKVKFQFVATAVISGAAVAVGILSYQRWQQQDKVDKLKESLPTLEELEKITHQLTEYGTATPKTNRSPSPTTLSSSFPPALDKEDLHNQALALRAQQGDFDEEIIHEQLARNRSFLTPEGLQKVRDAFIIVVGCGGVGSHCAAAMARSGVGKMRLIDFDQVSLSSLNRHAVATLADVGMSKVLCLKRRLIAVTPWTLFDLRNEKFDAFSATELLAPWVEQDPHLFATGQTSNREEAAARRRKPDFVVDAIDNIDTKVALLAYCHSHAIPIISSMGAGCKSDPTRIFVGDISDSTDDPLSRSCRRRLKLHHNITHGIPVVYSQEKSSPGKATLLPISDDEFLRGAIDDLSPLPNFRARILPVLGTMPAVFGYTVANHVLLSLSGYPTDYRPAKGREKLYDAVLASVQAGEEKIAMRCNPADKEAHIGLRTPITVGDVAFLVEEVYRGKSVVSRLGTRLVLVRWKKVNTPPFGKRDTHATPDGVANNDHANNSKSTSLQNGYYNNVIRIEGQKSSTVRMSDLACMTREEAARHEREVVLGDKSAEELYDVEVLTRVEKAINEIKEAEMDERAMGKAMRAHGQKLVG